MTTLIEELGETLRYRVPPNLRVIAFDMDGVILDSMSTLTEIAVETISRAYGVSVKDARAGYYRTTGLPFAYQLEVLFPGDEKNSHVSELYEAEHLAVAPSLPTAPMAKMVLRKLCLDGFTTALVTSTRRQIVLASTQVLELGFDYIGGWSPDFTKTDQVLEACRRHGLSSQKSVLLGDSVSDRDVADQVGARFQMVANPNALAFTVSVLLRHL